MTTAFANLAEQVRSLSPLGIEGRVRQVVGLSIAVEQFPVAVVRAAEAYKPSILAEYLFDLSQTYSSFYQRLSVLKAETPAQRLSRARLCALVAGVLREGLGLLGMRTPRRI